MGLLTPEFGTVFWMVIVFAIVFFILAKYAFPVIIGMVDKRERYIKESLEAARLANEQLSTIKQQGEVLLAQARAEQTKMLQNAATQRDVIVAQAKEQARTEAARSLEETRAQIAAEKQSALNEIRQAAAILAVEMAEKLLREKLADEKKQDALLDRLMNEVKHNENF